MAAINVAEIRSMMDIKRNIRNVSVIAQADQGKTTVTEALVSKAGIVSGPVAEVTEQLAQAAVSQPERHSTNKSTAVSLHYTLTDEIVEREPDCNDFLINLIDSPGHVDFSSEVTAAIRVTDGALVVVDCISGMGVPTERLLQQAVEELVRPVVLLNKMDLALVTMKLDAETMYQHFQRIVESVNVVVATYDIEDGPMGDISVDPARGTVAFGSGLHGWAFTLKPFADHYSSKFQMESGKLMTRLWGENFFNHTEKKWTKEWTVGCSRGFTAFVLDPIFKLFAACMTGSHDQALQLIQKLGIKLTPEEEDLQQKQLLETAMRKWLPAENGLVQMVVSGVPSPVTAQQYRTDALYEGPLDDEAANAMRSCDPRGPLMMYISKMVPTGEQGRFYAFGRVFSGTARSGQVRIMGPNFSPDSADDLYMKSIQRTLLFMGNNHATIEDVPCGSICGLVGVDQFLVNTGTISTFNGAFAIKPLSC